LAVVLKPRSQTLAEVEPGGLGLTLIRTYSDKLSYRYNEGCNQLKFSTRWIEGR
jgi:anti-sigma regulatory factor (Ser/Thr protein kinase)